MGTEGEKIETAKTSFETAISQAWGNPKKVADSAFAELFRQPEDMGLDYNDQILYAKKIGILAGQAPDAQTFIQRFEKEILEHEIS